MIDSNAVITNMPICQALKPTAAIHGDAAGLSRSVAMVGAMVKAAKAKRAIPAGTETTISRPGTRSVRHRVSRQLVTKASQTPADVVPNSGKVKINRRFR